MDPVLTVRDLSVARPPAPAFSDLCFEVAVGESVGLTALGVMDLEPLLDVLAGLEPPVEGEVKWGALSSRDLARIHSPRQCYLLARKIRLEVGYLASTASLLQNLSISENIALPYRYHASTGEGEVSARVSRLTELLKIAAEAEQRPADLSKGVRRRAELARALILEPRLLILDSALSGLDRGSTSIMVEVLKAQREGGMAILAASQDPLELAALCSRVLVLDRGRQAGCLSGKDLEDRGLLSDGEALLKKF